MFDFRKWFSEKILGRKPKQAPKPFTRTPGNSYYPHAVTPSMAELNRTRAQREATLAAERRRKQREEERARYEQTVEPSDYGTPYAAGGAIIAYGENSPGSEISPSTPQQDEPKNTPDSWGSSPTSYEPPTSYHSPSHSSDYGSSSSHSSHDSGGGYSSSSDSGSSYSGGSDSSW